MVMNAMKERRSIRKYKPDMVPREIIDQILEAGLYAASGRGQQCVITIAVTDKELRDKLAKVNAKIAGMPETSDPFYGAPVVLIVLADKNWPTHVYDGSLVMGNLMLAAHTMGVGSCWIHRAREMFDTEEGKDILRSLGIEGNYVGIANCILGYPEGEIPEARPRKENYVYFAD